MADKFTGTEGVLIDLNGTLVDLFDARPIAGAIEAIELLRDLSLKCKFVPSNPKENCISTQMRLDTLGFKIAAEEIFNSLMATKYFIEEKEGRPYLLMPEDDKQNFCGMDCSNPNFVVVGLPPSNLSYADINYAFQLIKKGADLIATNRARSYKTGRGNNLSMAAGGIIAALEYSSDKECQVVGRMSKNYFQAASGSMGVPLENCVMIGDDWREDIIPAIDVGMKAILVRKGKYQTGDEKRINRPKTSFHVAADVQEALALLS